ncbi:hypothetical protein N0V82_010063 [Gnomoniopsis sp. IMI 355080]|nr:hypothetical protein N0V82_010063 [Gnomoniopsis sp. IMI 355080]
MKSFLDNLSTRRSGREPPPLPIAIKTKDLGFDRRAQSPASTVASARTSTDEKMAKNHHHGLGILDGKDWDDVKGLDWEEKQSWKAPTLTEISLLSPRSLRSPKAGWVLRRLRSVFSAVWPKAKPNAQAEPLRKTAYLDGIRGFAAFLVYWQHHGLWAHFPLQTQLIENVFGFEGQYAFAAFPGVRLLFNGGHFAVATFFVISGYVLSTKPLSLIHAGEQAKLADNLSSQLFRRWLRLYIPLIATTFLYMLTWHAFGGLWIGGIKKQGNFRDELWWWYCELKNFSFMFNSGGEPWLSYNFHLWSIPVEMKGSIVVYTALLAFSRCTTKARLWCTLGLMFYFMYIADGWYCTLFVTGMFLADLDLLAAKNALPRVMARLSPYKDFIYYHLLVIALYLGGIPTPSTNFADLQRSRGWYYLSFLKPQAAFDYKWFYLFIAATFLVAATPRIPWLRRFFETRFCQYLGRVSYALYLVHGPILWTLGDRLYTAVGWVGSNGLEQFTALSWWVNRFPLPMQGPLGMEVAFLLPHVILLPVTFWVAEGVTRWIDEPAVRFAQSLMKRTMPVVATENGGGGGLGAAPAMQVGMGKKLDA